jgi:hypothetical protein
MVLESEFIHVEVAYALPHQQKIIRLRVAAESTVQAIIEQSGILSVFPDIDLTKNKLGVYGKAVRLEQLVFDGDRIEIYRPLVADPREIRKQRLAKR